ncbi:MAG: HD domain-containing protein [Deltaproteobacteria bacterium]|nr:HD domain-containing protein [Deltaproteobacteria bacterium]
MDENHRILIIDDDPEVRNSYRQILALHEDPDRTNTEALMQAGARLFQDESKSSDRPANSAYDLTLVENGEAGVAAVKASMESGRPYALAFVDMKMPGMDGAETARRIWEADPAINIFIVTAYSEATPDQVVRSTGRDDLFYLRKPFTSQEIRQFARCLTTQWSLREDQKQMAAELEGANEGLEERVRERTRAVEQSEAELKTTLKQLRKALNAAIEALAAAAEARDPYTAGHQRRVANLARAIATELGLPKDDIEAIRMAGAIHDIGKIRVPSEILNRPGKITEVEMQLIRMHPEVGFEILKLIDFPWPVAEIEREHHERLDGSGYPRGLKDGEILMPARIIAVADVVEAMTAHRPYRPALGLDAALAEIEKNRGILYDAAAVDACVRLFREKAFQLSGEAALEA